MDEPIEPEGFIGPLLVTEATSAPEVAPVVTPEPAPAPKPKRSTPKKPAPSITPDADTSFPGFTIVDF